MRLKNYLIFFVAACLTDICVMRLCARPPLKNFCQALENKCGRLAVTGVQAGVGGSVGALVLRRMQKDA